MSASRIRNIKWLGILAAISSALAAGAAGDYSTALGIVGAALSSAGIFGAPSDQRLGPIE